MARCRSHEDVEAARQVGARRQARPVGAYVARVPGWFGQSRLRGRACRRAPTWVRFQGARRQGGAWRKSCTYLRERRMLCGRAADGIQKTEGRMRQAGPGEKKKRGCTGDVMELRDKVRFECLSVLCNPTPTASCRPAIERSSFLGIQILLMRPPIEPIQPFSKGKYTANFKSEQGSRAFFADSSLF